MIEDRGYFAFRPLTPERWPDLAALFGDHGAYGGCWCMYWRITRRQFSQQQGQGNREAFKEIVEEGKVPGILAYKEQKPVGWISVASREQFGSLERSPVLQRIDEEPVWSIVCFFVDRQIRGEGLCVSLIQAANEFVRRQGGRIVEAYPTIPSKEGLAPVSVYMGLPEMFEKAGFEQVARPSKSKVIMRYYIKS